MAAENVVLGPHAKRRRWEPASVADEMLQEEDDDDGLEWGAIVVGVDEDDAVDDTSRQVLHTQQVLLRQTVEIAYLYGRAGSYAALRTHALAGSSNLVLQTSFRSNFDVQA